MRLHRHRKACQSERKHDKIAHGMVPSFCLC
jgi:hypothetical protein